MIRATVEDPAAHTGDAAQTVVARLRRSDYPALRRVTCENRGDVLVLKGTVPTYHLKQIAQELAAHTCGVRAVKNEVHVPLRS